MWGTLWKVPSVLLKADTGANVNLMNSKTFDSLFDRKVLEFTSLRMEAYGNNNAVEVLGKFHAFLIWKGKVYRQLFYVTNVNNSPSLISRDTCYTLGIIKPYYSVETDSSSSSFQGILQATPTQSSKHLDQSNMQGECESHCENEGTVTESWNCSSKCCIMKDDPQWAPLTRARILDVYSDVFTWIRKFPGELYEFQLKENAKPTRHAPRKVPIHLQDAFHEEIRNLEQLGILEPVKEVTELVNSFVIMEKKVPLDSSNSHSPGHTVKKTVNLPWPRDLNEALEREPYYTHSTEKITGKFHGMTRFTIADFNNGYWMVVLHPDSRKLTTMALDIGGASWLDFQSKPGKFQQPTASGSSGGSSGNAEYPSKHGGKGKKVPLPTDICWRYGKGWHKKGQPCKALEAVCRNCSIKGHFEKVCMKGGKCSTHLVDVPEASNSSTGEPSYYNEHRDPVYAHMVSVCDNKCKHLIQFPISTELGNVRNSVESSKCYTEMY